MSLAVPSSSTNIRPDIPLSDVYHTLEKDHAAMVELQKLEASHHRIYIIHHRL